ncbi:MAG TPA: CoA transferase [Candidatus Limnocylindria bacterium]|nr:CoA transferase [Candidatus Limnocylindria bacterium]
MTAAASLLDGVVVLDVATSAGAHCGRVLADLGADVIKVEPPDGDPGRGAPPFIGGRPGPDRSLPWLALNANKRGVTVDRGTERGRAQWAGLVARADVVVQSDATLAYEDVARANARAVLVTITPYGATGPLAGIPASDLEVTAASGALHLAGEPGRAPVRTTLPQSPFWTGMYAAMGALTALAARALTGRGQHVDVSAQASMATVHPPAIVFWDLLREEHHRLGPYLLGRSIVGARFRNIWPCADGHVSFAIQGGAIGRHTGRSLVAWMRERAFDAPRLSAVDWDAFDNRTLAQADVDALEAEIGPFLLTLTKREFFEGVVARNMLGYPVSDVRDLRADAQLAAREFWRTLPTEEGDLALPGGFAIFDGARPRACRPAPRLGEHNAEVFGAVPA